MVKMTLKILDIQIYGIVLALYLYFLTLTNPINGFKIELIPRTSIDSVLFPKDLTPEEIHHIIAELSRDRAYSLEKLNHEPEETLKQPISSFPYSNLYLAKISIGSNQFSPYLVVDTGSDDTWLQCEGCTSCFPLKEGSFPVAKSKTYRSLACDHPFCIPKLCNKSVCSYNWKYKEGGVSKGVLSSESLTFPGGNSTNITFKSIIFGCAYDNQNVTFIGSLGQQGDNIIAGVFGLGGGQRSILRQLEPETNLRFSYCLRAYLTSDTTFLRFGPDAELKGNDKQKVQTIGLNLGRLPRYYVNVTGISVDGKLINIDPALLEPKEGAGSGGFAIDSGIGPTLLVPDAYKVLRSEVMYHMTRKGFFPAKVLHVPYDLCFYFPPAANANASETLFPSMVIHFQGADLFLDPSTVVGHIGTQLLCLLFLPTYPSGPNILGAFQQANQHFLFDVGKSTVSFVSEACD